MRYVQRSIPCATHLSDNRLSGACFEHFFSWRSRSRTVSQLSHIARSFFRVSKDSACHGWHTCNKPLTKEHLNQAKAKIILTVQSEVYKEEIGCIQGGKPVPKHSPLSKLCPFIDSHGLLRVGGCLAIAQITSDESHPVPVPCRHHVVTLPVRHFHK